MTLYEIYIDDYADQKVAQSVPTDENNQYIKILIQSIIITS